VTAAAEVATTAAAEAAAGKAVAASESKIEAAAEVEVARPEGHHTSLFNSMREGTRRVDMDPTDDTWTCPSCTLVNSIFELQVKSDKEGTPMMFTLSWVC
jgi:hypothetical protein